MADQLFTMSYRAEHLRGAGGSARRKSCNPASVLVTVCRMPVITPPCQCFDVTPRDETRPATHERLHVSTLPYWSQAQCTYKFRSARPDPARFLRKGGSSTRPQSAPQASTPAPPPAGASQPRANPPNSLFRTYYERGDLPICLDHRGSKTLLRWRVSPESLDYHFFLPVFLSGIRETADPHRFMAIKVRWAAHALGNTMGKNRELKTCCGWVVPRWCPSSRSSSCPSRLPSTPVTTRHAFDTIGKYTLHQHPQVVCIALRLLQQLAMASQQSGQALVPFYRQLLPILNLFLTRNQVGIIPRCTISTLRIQANTPRNTFVSPQRLGDCIMYSQQEQQCLGDLIAATLQVLERTGGLEAFAGIKAMCPTYETCVHAS